jgi:hypothetical protein
MEKNLLSFALGCIVIGTIAATSSNNQKVLLIKPATPELVITKTFNSTDIENINQYILKKCKEGFILKSNSLVVICKVNYTISYSTIIIMEKY